MDNNYQELKNQADTLRKQNRYAEALTIYEKLWQERGDEPDKWIGWGYAQCLRKEKQSEKALGICQDVYRLDNAFEINNSLYGWCVYDVGIKQAEEQFDESKFLKAANAIVELTQQGEYSPYGRAVFAVIHYLESQRKTIDNKQSLTGSDYRDREEINKNILDWLDKLVVSQLSVYSNKKSDGTTYVSEREDWYNSRAKALLSLKMYDECSQVCAKALEDIKDIHYGYDVWFRWYGAQSYIALEQYYKAIDYLEYILQQKQDFWIRREYAKCLTQLGRNDEAIQQLSDAALFPKGLGFRWEVYLDLGNLLYESGQNELAVKHIMLATAIRQNQGWEKIPGNLQDALDRSNLSLENIPDAKKLHSGLQSFWKSMKPRPKTTHSGKISLIHPNGKSGHIQSDDGNTYFFGMRSYKSDKEATVGLLVGFNLQKNENNRTGKQELHAVDIFVNE